MDYQIKVLHLQDRGNYLIALTRGLLDAGGFERLFRLIKDASERETNCKILIDLADAICHFEPPDIERIVEDLNGDLQTRDHRVALISPADIGQYDQLSELRAGLAVCGLKIAVFTHTKAAADWLAESP